MNHVELATSTNTNPVDFVTYLETQLELQEITSIEKHHTLTKPFLRDVCSKLDTIKAVDHYIRGLGLIYDRYDRAFSLPYVSKMYFERRDFVDRIIAEAEANKLGEIEQEILDGLLEEIEVEDTLTTSSDFCVESLPIIDIKVSCCGNISSPLNSSVLSSKDFISSGKNISGNKVECSIIGFGDFEFEGVDGLSQDDFNKMCRNNT